MKKEKVLELACMIVSACLQNPINGQYSDPYRTYDRQTFLRNEIQMITQFVGEMGILIED